MNHILTSDYLFEMYGAYGVFISKHFKATVTIKADLSEYDTELNRYGLSKQKLKKHIKDMTSKGILSCSVSRKSYTKYMTLRLNDNFS